MQEPATGAKHLIRERSCLTVRHASLSRKVSPGNMPMHRGRRRQHRQRFAASDAAAEAHNHHPYRHVAP